MHQSGTILTGVESIKYFKEFLDNASKHYSGIFILCDSNSREHCLPVLVSRFELPANATILEIEPGEKNKNLDTCTRIWKELALLGADRHSLMICLGGGVVCDMGGFIASTYQRGIDFIYLPTTLLAQVDAAIGGKTGVNLNGLKNYVGVFSSPKSVFIFTEFLKTLTGNELLSGYAEVVKHALLRSKKSFDQLIIRFPDRHAVHANADWSTVVEDAVKVKSNVVQSDPYEQGLRKVLNLGHTVGHAFESHTIVRGGALLHGFAVAMGLAVELKLSVINCGFPADMATEISSYLYKVFPFYSFKTEDIGRITDLMGFDKKNKAGKIQMTLIRQPGDLITDVVCERETIENCLAEYLSEGEDFN